MLSVGGRQDRWAAIKLWKISPVWVMQLLCKVRQSATHHISQRISPFVHLHCYLFTCLGKPLQLPCADVLTMWVKLESGVVNEVSRTSALMKLAGRTYNLVMTTENHLVSSQEEQSLANKKWHGQEEFSRAFFFFFYLSLLCIIKWKWKTCFTSELLGAETGVQGFS